MKKIEAYISNDGQICREKSGAMMLDLRQETKSTIEQVANETGAPVGLIENFFNSVALSYARDGETYTLRPFNPKNFMRRIRHLRGLFWAAKAQYEMELAQEKTAAEHKHDEEDIPF
jgi:hypothetical protein